MLLALPLRQDLFPDLHAVFTLSFAYGEDPFLISIAFDSAAYARILVGEQDSEHAVDLLDNLFRFLKAMDFLTLFGTYLIALGATRQTLSERHKLFKSSLIHRYRLLQHLPRNMTLR